MCDKRFFDGRVRVILIKSRSAAVRLTFGEHITRWGSPCDCGNKATCISQLEMDEDIVSLESGNLGDVDVNNRKGILVAYVKH